MVNFLFHAYAYVQNEHFKTTFSNYQYLLLSNKNTESMNNGFICKEHSKFRITCIETKHILGLL